MKCHLFRLCWQRIFCALPCGAAGSSEKDLQKEAAVPTGLKTLETLSGSYTVEGSFIFGISILIIGITLGWGFTFYRDSSQFIETVQTKEVRPVKTFRLLQAGKEIVYR